MEDDDRKHELVDKLDKQGEDEPSEDVMDIDEAAKNAGLRPDPENNIKELNDVSDLEDDAREN